MVIILHILPAIPLFILAANGDRKHNTLTPRYHLLCEYLLFLFLFVCVAWVHEIHIPYTSRPRVLYVKNLVNILLSKTGEVFRSTATGL
jgi:hypothetical protein